jgi:hypothetical protein
LCRLSPSTDNQPRSGDLGKPGTEVPGKDIEQEPSPVRNDTDL